jgi:hypothetical protein
MRKLIAEAVLLGCALISMQALAQEPSLDMFYGSKDFGGGKIGYEYFLNRAGSLTAIDFNYLTRSKRSEHAEYWSNYYGVSLELAYLNGYDYHFADKGTADFGAWWLMLYIADRIYVKDSKTVRPYFDIAGGLGQGSITVEGSEEDELDISGGNLTVLRLDAGTGLEIMLGKNYALDLGISIDGTIGAMQSLFDSADLGLVGAQAKVGLSRWSEK